MFDNLEFWLAILAFGIIFTIFKPIRTVVIGTLLGAILGSLLMLIKFDSYIFKVLSELGLDLSNLQMWEIGIFLGLLFSILKIIIDMFRE